jgi:hypothetical protein
MISPLMISNPASQNGRIIVLREFDSSNDAKPAGAAARGSESEDDFRHRMHVNLAAAIAILVLITVGVLLANAMVETEKAQGCYQSGDHTCSLL